LHDKHKRLWEDPKSKQWIDNSIPMGLGHRLIYHKIFFTYLLQWEQAYLVVLIKTVTKQKN
jgi:hypothetical protein